MGITIALIRMIRPRMRSNIGNFDSPAAARRPRPKTARIAVAIQSPVLSANKRVRSFARAGETITSTPVAAMNAHRINVNAVMSAFYRFNFLIPNFYLDYESTIYARRRRPFRTGGARSEEKRPLVSTRPRFTQRV